MYDVSAQSVDERMINIRYYYCFYCFVVVVVVVVIICHICYSLSIK